MPPDLILIPVLVLTAAAFLAAGAGYRRIAWLLPVACLATLAGCALIFFAAATLAEPHSPQNEWRGLSVVFALWLTAVSAAPLFIVSAYFLAFRRPENRRRERRSPLLTGLGCAVLVVIVARIGPWIYFQYFGSQSDAALAREVLQPRYSDPVSARVEIGRRGPRMVPLVIRELQTYPAAQARRFDASDPNRALKEALTALGMLGGPEAVAELRSWTERDVADDVRTAAFAALAQAEGRNSARADGPGAAEKRREDAAAIFDRLQKTPRLELRYGQRQELCHALAVMHATEQVRPMATLLQNGKCRECAECLQEMHDPEADALLVELGSSGERNTRITVFAAIKKTRARAPFIDVQLAGIFDEDAYVRESACISLCGSLSVSGRIQPFIAAVDGYPCWDVRNLADWRPRAEEIRSALEQMHLVGPASPPAGRP